MGSEQRREKRPTPQFEPPSAIIHTSTWQGQAELGSREVLRVVPRVLVGPGADQDVVPLTPAALVGKPEESGGVGGRV